MVKQNEILKAINKILVAAYPDYTVYIQVCPKDFDRPSFKIELVRISMIDVCRSSIEKTAYYTITCFATTDDYYRSNLEELTNIQDTILQELQSGYIKVGDRAIAVKGSTGGSDQDRAYIDLQLEYIDNRTDKVDQTPLVASVSTRIKEEH